MALWDRITSRGRVEDRRGMVPVAVGGLGVSGVLLYLLANILLGGQVDVGEVLGQLDQAQQVQQQNIDVKGFEGNDSYEQFTSTVLGSNNDMWQSIFEKNNRTYNPPTLVLFRTATDSACGTATSEVGPHYCPLDQTIYLDETFFDELRNRFGAKGGDVAEAYVISHEVGHHVQNELGLFEQVNQEYNADSNQGNDLSVRMELQADCFAGLWANSIKNAGVFLPGEISEAIDAAAAVGDDRIQKKVTGRIQPETWTHGSSQQRAQWFNKGYDEGKLQSCNTFE